MGGLTRRRLVRTGWAGAVGAVLLACAPGGGSTGGQGQPQAGGSGKAVTLRLGSRSTDPSPSWDEVQAGKALFEQLHPKLTVEITGGMSDQKFLTGAAAGDAWDVQDTCCSQIPIEARAGVLMKLDPFIKAAFKDADVKDWIEWQYKFYFIDGVQYGIGKYMGTTALYFNKDWFRQKGVALPDDTWDWNRYREAMVRLSDAPNQKWGANLANSMSADRRQAKVHQNGGHYVDPKDDTRAVLDSPQTIEAFQWIKDRMWQDNGSIRLDQRPGADQGAPLGDRQLFTSGLTAMWEDGSWSLLPVLQDKPGFDWDVVTLPKGAVQRDVLATTDGWAMWGQTRSVDDAWLLFTFFNSDDWYGIQSKRLQPVRLSWMPKWITLLTQTNPELQGKNLKAFTTPAEQGYGRPWELFRFEAAVDPLIKDAYDKAVNLNQAPVKDTMADLARQINEVQQQQLQQAGGRK